jgi:hypothetical protein
MNRSSVVNSKHESILPFLGVYRQLVPKTQNAHLCMVPPWIEKENIMLYIKSDNYNPHTERILIKLSSV